MVFNPPRVRIGSLVYWFAGGNSLLDPCPGFVTRQPDNIHGLLTVNVMSPSLRNFEIHEGVCHCNDPRGRGIMMDEGGWLTVEEYDLLQHTRKDEDRLKREKQDEMLEKEGQEKSAIMAAMHK
jgi:hypothetical protein